MKAERENFYAKCKHQNKEVGEPARQQNGFSENKVGWTSAFTAALLNVVALLFAH